MLICKLEMQSSRPDIQPYSVGEIRIGQIAGDCFIANYAVEIDKASRQARMPGIWRTGEVRGFDHSMLGPYDLLLRALVACLGGRSWRAVHAIPPNTCTFSDTLETA